LTAIRLIVCEWAVLEGGFDLGLLCDETVDLGGIAMSIPLFAVVVFFKVSSFAPIWTRTGLIWIEVYGRGLRFDLISF
jgi:hypothetical protein